MSNLRQPPAEKSARLPGWTEGEWIKLADGQEWSFPPPESVPGYGVWARQASREVWERIVGLPSMDPATLYGLVQGLMTGNPTEGMETLRRVLALYQTGHKITSELLKRNYDLTFADCEKLLPFNYQVEEFIDPKSKLHTATPALLAIFNAAIKATGVNVMDEVERLILEARAGRSRLEAEEVEES